MRLVVFFDLPVETSKQRRAYTLFHKSLINFGFDMLQYSVYTRYCANNTACDKYIYKIKSIKPKEGDVRLLKITENQYENMVVLVGEKTDRQLLENDSLLIEID